MLVANNLFIERIGVGGYLSRFQMLQEEMAMDSSKIVTRSDRAHWYGIQCDRVYE